MAKAVALRAFTEESDEEPDPANQAAELQARRVWPSNWTRSGSQPSRLPPPAAWTRPGRCWGGRCGCCRAARSCTSCTRRRVLTELGAAWEALRAAGRAAELAPAWAEAHVTLGRAQRNYGEPLLAEASYDRALELLQPDAAGALATEVSEVRALASRQREAGPGVRARVMGEGPEGPAPAEQAPAEGPSEGAAGAGKDRPDAAEEAGTGADGGEAGKGAAGTRGAGGEAEPGEAGQAERGRAG
ncbi:hypothetical protein HYH03_018130 [Edaphochlamys debaryana]|uniref:Uncharacterized protein n=1 Tax=Edaphochlamys debaryana TaxID=47281 RepID=A0A836BPU7_9CHLO|nr:hypothetical protein HYH03_018130 [Edaphochlamys debaryana]|eukprot:KAG2482953.1 hypothetical protein HYH03_018130 [Edaphochlamys debaryana]